MGHTTKNGAKAILNRSSPMKNTLEMPFYKKPTQ